MYINAVAHPEGGTPKEKEKRRFNVTMTEVIQEGCKEKWTLFFK